MTPARATWSTGFFQAEIYRLALEDLGYDVGSPADKELGNPLFYESVAQGDVDFWANGWFPLHEVYRDTFEGEASIAGTVVESGALQGYLIDKETSEELDVTNLEDLKREEVKQALDDNGDGKADLVACPAGWGCEVTIEHHLDAYELREHVNSIKAGYSASMADAVAQHEEGDPILFYTWTPNWTVHELVPGEDVVWLEVPFPSLPEGQKQFEDDTEVTVTGCAAENPCLLGWPANDINVVANNGFLEENPAAKRLFQVMSIPLEDIAEQNALMQEGEDSQEDIERHAREWVQEHEETWERWLQEAIEMLPEVEVQATPDQGTAPLEVDFEAIAEDADGTIERYDWDFGDGTTVEDGGAAESHTYEEAGTFTAEVTVTDDDELTATASVKIEVLTPSPSGKVYEVTVIPVGSRTLFTDCFRFEDEGSLTVDGLGSGRWTELRVGEQAARWWGAAGDWGFSVGFQGLTAPEDGSNLLARGAHRSGAAFRIFGEVNPECGTERESTQESAAGWRTGS